MSISAVLKRVSTGNGNFQVSIVAADGNCLFEAYLRGIKEIYKEQAGALIYTIPLFLTAGKVYPRAKSPHQNIKQIEVLVNKSFSKQSFSSSI